VELKKLHIDATPKTPQIDFDHTTGELVLTGRSIPENAAKVYESVLQWVNVYKNSPKRMTNLKLNLEYFNTSSTLWLAKIVQSLSKIKNKSCTLMIHIFIGIEEFENMEGDELKDELHPIIQLIDYTDISVGIKLYGTSEDGKIVKEIMVLI
jgi:hypothetical protein